MTYGLIGCPLSHSFSAELHRYIGDYPYALREIEKADLSHFFEKKDFRAVNVTIPYKQTVIPYMDELSYEAKRIGSVNTVVNRNGKLYGYNTDYAGFAAMLDKAGMDVQGKTVVILGTGGTSKTAQAVVRDRMAKNVCVVSRSPKGGELSYKEATESGKGDIIINTTPVGMYPHDEEVPMDLAAFPHLEAVADVIYHPLNTTLVMQARARGLKCIGGLYMLTYQAIKASELFFDTTYPPSLCEAVYEKILNEKRNTVLIGMPGCGKTTVGKRLAEKTSRRFFDVDEEIEKQYGDTPRHLIETKGEEAFRQYESEVIRRLSAVSSAVIATGGGSVLREENVMRLRRNGYLIYLKRDVNSLPISLDRPLSSSREALLKLYGERRRIYESVCDKQIMNNE